jgi:gliding motility associated protien GldN
MLKSKKMNYLKKWTSFGFACFFSLTCFGQNVLTESGNPQNTVPRDDIYERKIMSEKLILPYDHLHEKDIFKEKRVWRLIDIREKPNQHFANIKEPFINILLEHAREGDIQAFSVMAKDGTDGDNFSNPLSQQEVSVIGRSIDTISYFDPEDFSERVDVVVNELNPEDVKQYRLKEVWFFDEETSQMDVRILGIAPIINRYDENGNFLNSGAMFWTYYPELRPVLSRHACYNSHNDVNHQSWEDIFEARMFSSYIIKESNVHDRRVQDYTSGIAALVEADKIKDDLFHFEHDIWSY